MADLSGTQIDTKYHLIKRLGVGTFGDVYQGKNIYDDLLVAVKLLKFELTEETLSDFINEARSMFKLQHMHIVPLLDFGIDKPSKLPFLVMAYAPHGTLSQRHPVGTRVPLETVLSYVKPIASALQYAHTNRVIHRDVKPANILLGDNNAVLLSDFGIAVTAHSDHSLSTQNMGGTLPYMAPEQIQGRPQPASDQYSLGIVVYEWLCGERPFQGSIEWITHQHFHTAPPPLRTKNPTIPPAIEQVVLKALAKHPQERYPNIQAFAHALEDAYKQSLPPKDISVRPQPLSNAQTEDKTPIQPLPTPYTTIQLPSTLSQPGAKSDIDSPIVSTPSRNGSIMPFPQREPDPVPETPIPSRTSRQLPPAALVAGGVIAGAAAASVAAPARNNPASGRTVPATGAGMSTVATRPGRIGGQPPRSTPPGRGGHGGGGQRPINRRDLLLAGLIILLLASLLYGGLVYAQPTNPISKGIRGALGLSPSGTVAITPDSRPVSDTYTLTSGNTTDPAARTVAMRTVTGTAESTPVHVNATGHNQTTAAQAHGTITFFSAVAAAQQVNAGTRLPVGGGVTLVTDEIAFIPAANPPTEGQKTVTAHAEPAGPAGNIGALVLNGVGCCAAGIVVSNPTAFTGGTDAPNYTFLKSSDVTNAITQQTLDTTKQNALSNLSKQLHTGEQLFGTTQCNPVISADQPIGDNGAGQPVSNANVTYRMKCTSTTYDNAGAQTIASGLLAQKAATTLPAGYTPISNIQVNLTNQTTANNTTSFFFTAKGLWTYQFSDQQKQNLAMSIAGKTVAEAEAILRNTPGIGKATITLGSGNNLPSDPNQLSVQVQPLTGVGSTSVTAPTAPPQSPPTIAAPVIQGGVATGK